MSEHEDEVHKDKKVYKIQIDKDHFEVTKAQPTARELLTIAGKVPPRPAARRQRGRRANLLDGSGRRIRLADGDPQTTRGA